ncbi:Aldo/keto reductase [Schizophyllum commune H4-8]|uniref:NADP-dependent oxidoreductase domain-containing protein n=1 Tax=Schizophyllum commune (strain H4-8 / FGSC 9210) TaxID=578458 RepID=D8PY46_SCHCM|nr:Aldo/keto reductase [Schizophyllum commune H4-8]KAI5897173.1 Aldo/keto reductase [Schizophyllum commune H4-8]
MSVNTEFPQRRLGANGPLVSAIGYGAMGIGAFYGASDEKESLETLTYCADRGLTFWDTAEIYGSSEATIGKWLSLTSRRQSVFLATKWAGSLAYADSRPSTLRRGIEAALARLQTDYIDLFYQHRVDPQVPIEVVMETFRPYVEEGKIRWLGLSNCSREVLGRAKAVKGVGEKLVAVQMEFSPFETELEKNGFIDYARGLGVSVVAYSPLGRGMISGRYKSIDDFPQDDVRRFYPRFQPENFPKNLELVDKFHAVARKLNATPAQVALAWILAEHPDMIPIPGSRGIARTEENARGAEVVLSAEDQKALRDAVENATVAGGRMPKGWMIEHDCIPLKEWKGEEGWKMPVPGGPVLDA